MRGMLHCNYNYYSHKSPQTPTNYNLITPIN